MTPLQQRMIEDMTVRGLAKSTQHAYLRAVRELAAYYKRSPDTLSSRDSALSLPASRGTGPHVGTCNTIVHGFRFFYGTTLGRSAMRFAIPLAKEPSTLPVILSRHDIRQLVAAAESLRDRTLLQVTYNAGLRASEVVHLQIAHIDSRRMCLRITQGKRQKDREALLSPQLLQDLRAYWRVYRPGPWLFPGRDGAQPLARKTAYLIFQRAKDQAGITKPGGPAFTAACVRDPSPGGRGGPPYHPALDGPYEYPDHPPVFSRGPTAPPEDAVAPGTPG